MVELETIKIGDIVLLELKNKDQNSRVVGFVEAICRENITLSEYDMNLENQRSWWDRADIEPSEYQITDIEKCQKLIPETNHPYR